MGAIGSITTVIPSVPSVPAPSQASAPPVQLPTSSSTQSPQDQVVLQAATQQQEQQTAIQQELALQATYPVGHTVSVTFKDAIGQPITESRDVISGEVSYSPEPEYVRPLNIIA